ncbi:hypothetical protein BA895_21785 [Humibacillus sp. DSM 29435]|nr:hypothetical protein BA895_21785 [Humibacillus sp. DSM 29435]
MEQRGRTAHGSLFGGAQASEDGAIIEVFLTRDDPAVEADLRAAAKLSPTQIRFRTGATTVAQQDALHNRVTTAAPSLRKAGYRLDSWILNFATRREVITLTDGTPAQVAKLRRQFGPEVDVKAKPDSPARVTADRFSDTAPWNGGDFISDTVSTCTSGIPAHNGAGAQYLVTAGHCFNLGANIFNYSASLNHGGRGYLGRVSTRAQTERDMDAELISTRLSNLIWTGSSTSPTRTVIAGTAGSPGHKKVCHSGAYEGEKCGLTIDGVGCKNFPGVLTYCHLLHASSTNPQAVGPGDSGGPVYRMVDGQLRIVGTVTGGDGTSARCGNWSPQNNRICRSNLWYTDWNAVASRWSLHIGGLG